MLPTKRKSLVCCRTEQGVAAVKSVARKSWIEVPIDVDVRNDRELCLIVSCEPMRLHRLLTPKDRAHILSVEPWESVTCQ